MKSICTAAESRRGLWHSLSSTMWLLPVIVVAALVRLHRLTEVSYWFDESFTLKMVDFSFLEMLQRITEDDNPPFFYVVLKLWIGLFGNSLVVPRLLSVLCGVSTVVGIFLFVREAYCRQNDDDAKLSSASFAAFMAAALVALSPAHIVWSNQVRMYSLTTALAAWSSYFLMRALHRSDSGFRPWVLFTFTALLQAYTHYFGLFALAAQYLFALGYVWFQRSPKEGLLTRRSISPVLISAVCCYFAWLPWLIPFLDHRQRVAEKFPAPALSWSNVGTTLCRAFDLQLALSVTPENGLIVAQACFVVIFLLVVRRRPADYYLALASVLPFFVAAVVSLFMRNIFVQRYLLSAQMFVLTSVAVVIGYIPWMTVRVATALFVIGAMAWLTREQSAARDFDATLPGMRGAVAYLDSHRQPGEPLVACNPMLFTSIVAYTRERDKAYTYGSPQTYPFFQGTAVMRNEEYLSHEELRQSTSDRIWTFDADQWMGYTVSVPMPTGWDEVSRSRFPEFNAEFVLRCYSRIDRK